MLRHLRYRHKLVQMRTRAKNCLQALAFSAGSAGRSRLDLTISRWCGLSGSLHQTTVPYLP